MWNATTVIEALVAEPELLPNDTRRGSTDTYSVMLELQMKVLVISFNAGVLAVRIESMISKSDYAFSDEWLTIRAVRGEGGRTSLLCSDD